MIVTIGLVLTGLVVAKPCNHKLNYAVKEVHNPPSEWTKVQEAPGDALLSLRIGLKMDRWDELERHLNEGIRTEVR
jgi:hypothetical protein